LVPCLQKLEETLRKLQDQKILIEHTRNTDRKVLA
jgi:hypothetical protein